MDWNIFLAIFVISLRNIFPIALILSIIFASFQRIKKPEYYRQIYLGIAAGIVASILVGSFFSEGLNNFDVSGYDSWIFTPLIINLTTFIAISLLIWFIFWLGQQGCVWQNLGSTNEILMGKYSRQLIFSLALFLVFTRGIEIILLLDWHREVQGLSDILGVMASLLLAAMMTGAFFYLQTRLNSSQYFLLMGIFLIFVTGGLIVNTIYNIEDNIAFINELSSRNNWCLFAKDSCLLGSLLWPENNFLSEQKFPFILLKILFGYHDHIYLIPLIGYLLFMTIVTKFYFQNLKNFS